MLAEITDARLGNLHFPWLSAQEIDIAGSSVWACRLSYAGELGYELHGPREHMLKIYDALWAAGKTRGIAD